MKDQQQAWRVLRAGWFILVGLLVLAAAGCNLPDQMALQAAGPGLWIDAPRNGIVLPLAPYKVVMHGSGEVPIAQYELYINDQLHASFGGVSRGLPNLQYAEYMWEPAAMGEYTLRVRAQSNTGGWSNEDEVTVRIGDPTLVPSVVVTLFGNETPTPVSSSTPEFTHTPVPTSTPTLTPTPEDVFARFMMNANCRKGPSTQYDVVTSLLTDQIVQVLGYNDDNTLWWYIQLPNSAARCWVSDTTVELSGDKAKVLYYNAPALPPTETPVTPGTPTYTPHPPTRTLTPTKTPVQIY